MGDRETRGQSLCEDRQRLGLLFQKPRDTQNTKARRDKEVSSPGAFGEGIICRCLGFRLLASRASNFFWFKPQSLWQYGSPRKPIQTPHRPVPCQLLRPHSRPLSPSFINPHTLGSFSVLISENLPPIQATETVCSPPRPYSTKSLLGWFFLLNLRVIAQMLISVRCKTPFNWNVIFSERSFPTTCLKLQPTFPCFYFLIPFMTIRHITYFIYLFIHFHHPFLKCKFCGDRNLKLFIAVYSAPKRSQ